jgi:hypothetical protein
VEYGQVWIGYKGVKTDLRKDGNRSSTDEQEFLRLRTRMDEILYCEEMMWLQRSQVAWLKEGARNTKFFHMKAAGRPKKNKIKRLRKEDGHITTNKQEMECMTRTFF